MTDKLMQPATTGSLLTRILETPDLPAQVRALPPAAFSALVRDIGVEDAGELVSLASNDYLANVLVAVGGAGGERLRPVDAIEAAMRSVAEGARLEAGPQRPTPRRLADVLFACSADRLFRRAHSASGSKPARPSRRR